MNNHAAWCLVAFAVTPGRDLDPALAAVPWEADGGGLMVPAMGSSQQPPRAAHKASWSKSLKPPHAPAATSRSSKVPAGAL